jgi:hypothetical protein
VHASELFQSITYALRRSESRGAAERRAGDEPAGGWSPACETPERLEKN